MTFGRAVTSSITTPSTQISCGRLVKSSKLPSLVPGFPLKYVVGPLQLRIPEIVSSRRPSYVLQAHLTPPTKMEPPSKRQKGGAGGGPQKQPQAKRKHKPLTPEVEIRLAIQIAARERSIDNAFAAYDRAKELGIKLALDSFACIMFLCSGGDDWENMLSPTADPVSSKLDPAGGISTSATNGAGNVSGEIVTTELVARGRALLEDMAAAEIVPNEICYTALARMEALAGNPDASFAIAVSIAEKGMLPRLRCFTPALVAYAERGDAAKAFQVDAAITAVGLESGENEFGRLLQAAAGGGVEYSAVEAVLYRMSRELQGVQPGTIARARAFFESDAANHLINSSKDISNANTNDTSSSKWVVEECLVDEDGTCPAAGGGIRLAAIDLTPSEYEEFKSGVAELAAKQERQPNDFKIFVEWLEQHGPFGVVIDAANVAFYGQNYESGGFSFAQVGEVVDRLHETHAGLRPLAVLHVNRTKSQPAQTAVAVALLDRLRAQNCFYATPNGSNDDWYWMYAAVAAGNNGLLVSNDEMRDHLFHMLSPKFFGKWKQRHQLRYTFTGSPDSLEFTHPPPFTTCVQKLEGTATPAWVLPCVDGTWTLAKVKE